jgi:UDP-4-amino-4,6-dideoxy-N-acetyl-beta-L-altrosamine N-acetyltransferase
MPNEQNRTEPKNIKLVQLTDISTESQLKVRDIRNEEAVRKWMYTDHAIELNEHLGWINRLKTDKKQIVFVILDEKDEPLGVVSVNAIDQLHKKTDWAYYLTENARGGLGSAIEYAFIDFVFNNLDMQKLNCEVIEGNDPVVKLHKKFLFKDEGFRRSNIVKGEKRIGVRFLGLTKEDWIAGKNNVFEKYQKVLNRFHISINWNETEKEKHPLDEIESARARNNLNWMNVLRLVLELSPEHGKELVTDIRNIDKEISELTDKLIAS